jgi:hypothetical protein
MLDLAQKGIYELIDIQKKIIPYAVGEVGQK